MPLGAIVRRPVLLLLPLALPLVLVGCRQSEYESTVTGTVTLDGQPLDHGTVVFKPVGGMSNPATGAIDSKGQYFLETTKEEGLSPGEYNVSVSSYEIDPDRPIGERQMDAKLLTPLKYASPQTSGLSYTVEPGANSIDLELSSEVE